MKHTIDMTLHIHAERIYGTKQVKFSAKACDMSKYGYIYLFEHPISIEVDIPDDFDMNSAEIDKLRKQKKQVQAEMQMQLTRIDEQINSLLAIEYTP